MMVLVDLAILMKFFLAEVMTLHLISHSEVTTAGLVIMVGMEVEMTSVVVLGVMVVPVVMRAIEENLHLAILAAMARTWGLLVVDTMVVG
jgi:fructosamine-3-kinase